MIVWVIALLLGPVFWLWIGLGRRAGVELAMGCSGVRMFLGVRGFLGIRVLLGVKGLPGVRGFLGVRALLGVKGLLGVTGFPGVMGCSGESSPIHGVCYGFELLQTCESLKHPFRIFKTRFPHPPSLIIYDNACRLHIYCLNREPHFFESTRFAVDRFHWRGHTGCSKGYSLDVYKNKKIKGINSQVNEQANSGLQKIRGQLTYMTINNFKLHCSLFLALKNMDKKAGLSLHCLHL